MRHMLAALCLLATPSIAQEVPRVAVDIAPINSLVVQMMQGGGHAVPDYSHRGFSTRLCHAPVRGARSTHADLVVWVGPALTHWLEEPLDTLADDAARLTLMSLAGAKTLPMRDPVELSEGEGHDHDLNHDGHSHEGDVDPHGWLSPSNAVLWTGVIAKTLGEIDTANAPAYTTNWEAFRQEMEDLEKEVSDKLRPYRDTPFVVLHDAFHYFEATFGVEVDAFIFPSDGSTPGPAQIKALRDHLTENPAVCAFTAPQENESLLRTVIEGQGTRIAVLDPMGDGSTPYATLIRQFADDMVACLSKG